MTWENNVMKQAGHKWWVGKGSLLIKKIKMSIKHWKVVYQNMHSI